MKTKFFFPFFIIFIYLVSMQIFAQEGYQSDRLTKLWETKEGLKVPESVLYVAKEDVLYVSNINGKAWEKEGNGFISKLSTKGEFISLEWVTGLNAPKGMGVYNGKLYVTCVDELVEIDIAAAKVINRYKNDKAINLNDVSVDKDGIVYVSDSAGKCIFCLKNGKLEVLVESDKIANTNGLLVNDGKLLAGSGNKAMSIDLKSKTITALVDETGYIDGFVAVGDGSFLVSDWQGHVQQIRTGKGGIKLLDTTPEKVNAADIEFIQKEKVLLVPTFLNNKVVAYKLKM